MLRECDLYIVTVQVFLTAKMDLEFCIEHIHL